MTDLALFEEAHYTILQQTQDSTYNTGASPTDPCLWDGSCPMPVHSYGQIGENIERKGLLPPAIVLLVQIFSSVWKALALTLVGFPIQILLWVFTIADIAWS